MEERNVGSIRGKIPNKALLTLKSNVSPRDIVSIDHITSHLT